MKCLFVVLPVIAASQTFFAAPDRLLEPDVSPELKKCVFGKLAEPKKICGAAPSCKPECVSAVKAAVAKLDGSCCELATKIPKDVCKEAIGKITKGMTIFTKQCQSSKLWSFDFKIEDSSNSTPTSAISSSMFAGMFSVVVGASALSLLAVWLKRRSSNLHARAAGEALNVDDDSDDALDARNLE